MSELRVSRVGTRQDLTSLEPDWRALNEVAETSSPFLSYSWAVTWWEHFGAGRDLWVLVLEDDEGVAGIAPLVRARRWCGPLPYRALEILGTGPLRFLGMGLADRADFLLARRRGECVRAVAQALLAEHRAWDVLDLRFVPETSTTLELLGRELNGSSARIRSERCAVSPYLTLTGSFDEYAAARGRNFRQGLERKLARLERHGEVRVDLDGHRSGRLPALLERVSEVSARSWKGQSGSALLSHPGARDFVQDLVKRLARYDGTYLASLWVEDRMAAYELGFRSHGKLWSYDSAYLPEFGEGSPGAFLTARLLRRAWSEGLREYDLLRGDHGYKRHWQSGTRSERQIVATTGRRGALAGRLAVEGKWWLKRRRWLASAQSRLAGKLQRGLVEAGLR